MKYTKDYYVPVVAKNKDYLVGFLDALSSMSPLFEVDFTALDSMRLNDILPNNQRRRNLTDEQIRETIFEQQVRNNLLETAKLPKEDEEIPFLEVHCNCGNYMKFDHPDQIPKTSLRCELCSNILIDYTGADQDDYEYDGDIERMFIGTDGEEFGEDEGEEEEEE